MFAVFHMRRCASCEADLVSDETSTTMTCNLGYIRRSMPSVHYTETPFIYCPTFPVTGSLPALYCPLPDSMNIHQFILRLSISAAAAAFSARWRHGDMCREKWRTAAVTGVRLKNRAGFVERSYDASARRVLTAPRPLLGTPGDS